MIKKFNTYNESLRDKMVPKSFDDINNSINNNEDKNEVLLNSTINGYIPGIKMALKDGADINYDSNIVLLNSIVYNKPEMFYELYDLTIKGLKDKSEKSKLINLIETEIYELNMDIIDTIVNNSKWLGYLDIFEDILGKVNVEQVIITHMDGIISRSQRKLVEILSEYFNDKNINLLNHFIDISWELRKYTITEVLKNRKNEIFYNESIRDKMIPKSDEYLYNLMIKYKIDYNTLIARIGYKQKYILNYIRDKYNFNMKDFYYYINGTVPSMYDIAVMLGDLIKSKPEDIIISDELIDIYTYEEIIHYRGNPEIIGINKEKLKELLDIKEEFIYKKI